MMMMMVMVQPNVNSTKGKRNKSNASREWWNREMKNRKKPVISLKSTQKYINIIWFWRCAMTTATIISSYNRTLHVCERIVYVNTTTRRFWPLTASNVIEKWIVYCDWIETMHSIQCTTTTTIYGTNSDWLSSRKTSRNIKKKQKGKKRKDEHNKQIQRRSSPIENGTAVHTTFTLKARR